MAGSVVAGRYVLERVIGRGASGQVWLGHDELLGRPVAVKQIGTAHDEHGQERAAREGRLAAQLNHPNIVAVFDLVGHRTKDDDTGESWETWDRWLVMEYVEGRDLASLVRDRGPLPQATAVHVIAQIADALAAAHEAGIVHRDVKPSNILITEQGQAKLSDFGIARGSADLALTRTGLVTGSPAYLAPEVASGRSATPASDVWSLGATLFHALAGHAPYRVESNEPADLLGTLYRIVHEPPPVLEGADAMAPLLAGTMHHDSSRRWTAAQVRDFLHGLPAPDESPTLQIPRPRLSTFSALVGVMSLLIVAALGAAVWYSTRGSDDHTPRTGSSAPATNTPSAEANGTAAAMRSFARDYVTTAAASPARGFELLSPAYQRASGGLVGYRGFWGRVVAIEQISGIRADSSAQTVSYRYRYRMRGGQVRTDDVTLRLQTQADGSFLIVGALG